MRTEESYTGVVARLLRVQLRRSLARALEDGRADLEAEAERQLPLPVNEPAVVAMDESR